MSAKLLEASMVATLETADTARREKQVQILPRSPMSFKQKSIKIMSKQLFLEDLAGKTEQEILNHIIETHEINPESISGIRLIAAYESVGAYGCDSSNWFLFERDGKLFENHGSHCSCFGFEGQWGPEETTLDYLKSDKFSLSCGGYDSDERSNREKLNQFLKSL